MVNPLSAQQKCGFLVNNDQLCPYLMDGFLPMIQSAKEMN
jgi:hypothetical protein